MLFRKRVLPILLVLSIVFTIAPSTFSKTKECIKPCGPFCCKPQETCMVSDPCMGDPACSSVPGFECISSKLFTNLLQAVGEMNLLTNDLRRKSKFSRSTTSKIKSLLKKITEALNVPKESCKEKSIDSITKLNTTVSKLQSKQCLEVEFRLRSSTKCVSHEVIEEFLPKLQFSYEKIKAYFQTDDNANLIPDICEE